jgi:hypothetical protein
MLRTPVLLKLLSLCLLAHAGLATAQQKPSEAPPKLEIIEPGSDTPVTVTPPKTGGAKVSEKKEGGRVTEVKVKTGKGGGYTMKAANPAATAHPGSTQSSTLNPPQWSVLEFDLSKKKKTSKEDVPEPAPAPPPPPMAPASK